MSLDAQRNKLRAYCKTMGIKLVEICSDEGISGGTMERPGLQAALRGLIRGRANTLIVVKLDRLTRSVKDLCTLVEDYFAKDKYDLISVCGMINTHTAAGRLMMLNFANYAQYERELISERTREAMQHLKAQGIHLGVAPYGYKHSQQLDDKGRRMLIQVPEEQEVIRHMVALHAQGLELRSIAKVLGEKGVTARRGGPWYANGISLLLAREGHHRRKRFKKTVKPQRICDNAQAATQARQLRAAGLSLRQIGRKLSEAGLAPPRGGEWHAPTVAELLTYRDAVDPTSAAERARALRRQGLSLRQIAGQLAQEGHFPPHGLRWHATSISNLLRAAPSTRVPPDVSARPLDPPA